MISIDSIFSKQVKQAFFFIKFTHCPYILNSINCKKKNRKGNMSYKIINYTVIMLLRLCDKPTGFDQNIY